MALEDRQQLSEIVEAADIAVRVASQLRHLKAERPLKDEYALLRAQEVLKAAIVGGTFIQTGQASGLQSTLRPLNSAADVQVYTHSDPANRSPAFDYEGLVAFLTEIEQVLASILVEERPDSNQIDTAVQFFSSLGNLLGTCADQRMRFTSGMVGGVAVMA